MNNAIVSTNNTTNNTTNNNTMITITTFTNLLNTLKIEREKNEVLRAIIKTNMALKEEVNKNNTVLREKVAEVEAAIDSVKADNTALEETVAVEGNLQQQLDSQKEAFSFLEEMEEVLTRSDVTVVTPIVNESILIEECRTALRSDEQSESAIEETETKLPTVAKPIKVERPILKAKAVKEVEVVLPVVDETAEVVSPVEVVQPIEEEVPTSDKKVETPEDVAKYFLDAEKQQKEASNNKVTPSPKTFNILVKKLADGTEVDWKEATFGEAIAESCKAEDMNLHIDSDVEDFISHFVDEFVNNEVYTFEMHNTFRKAVISSEETEKQITIQNVAKLVHYKVKSFFCTNMEAKLDLSDEEVEAAVAMLSDYSYLPEGHLNLKDCF